MSNGAASRAGWVALARRAEALGYAILVVPDHFRNALATAPALLAAAEATTTLRVGSLVFDISDTLRERRERYGISYWVVFEVAMEAFAPVVARLRGT